MKRRNIPPYTHRWNNMNTHLWSHSILYRIGAWYEWACVQICARLFSLTYTVLHDVQRRRPSSEIVYICARRENTKYFFFLSISQYFLSIHSLLCLSNNKHTTWNGQRVVEKKKKKKNTKITNFCIIIIIIITLYVQNVFKQIRHFSLHLLHFTGNLGCFSQIKLLLATSTWATAHSPFGWCVTETP